ncbi:MAG: hypothetical protein IKJ32_06165 [Clostridia bacterium]|nr:hypothetical protein [Clostridia bacterium]
MILKSSKELKQKDFKNEKELQTYIENNMQAILGFQFIETEFAVGNFRIDSLAYDKESNAFRIIEYKNIRNRSLVDQGYTYLKLMLARKADFVLKYNEKTNSSLKISDIDWSQSRVVFVSPVYTEYQLNAADFKNIPIDLVKVTKYEDEIVEVDFIKKTSNVKVEDVISDNTNTTEIKVYNEDDHLAKLSDSQKALYRKLKETILSLDDIDVDVKKLYIAFKGRTNIVDVVIKQKSLEVNINMKKGTLKDPLKIARDMTEKGHWANGDYRVTIKTEDDIDNLVPLIKQSIKVNGK